MGELLAAVRSAGTAWFQGRSFGFLRERHHQRQEGAWVYPLPEQEQIERYAEAFYGLAKLFQGMPCQKERLGDEDMEQIFLAVRESVCAGCGRQRECWENYYFQTCRSMYELFSELEYEGEISEEKAREREPFCGQYRAVAEKMTNYYGQARTELLWRNRMMEQRMAAGEQIFQTAELLKRAARGFVGSPRREQELYRKMRRELKALDLELGTIRVFACEEERLEIFLALRTLRPTCVSVKTIAEVLSESWGEKMRPSWNCRGAVGQEFASFHFVPDTRYQILCGISRITKAGELVSGDNYALLQKDTGKVVMSLADGMGSGVGACRESERVIELLEQFLDAGFPQETAVRMINSCMLLQNRDQMFSTIDLCMIDLYNAKCDMIKSGAAATFLKNGDEIEVIHSGAMPSGVMQQSDYESMHRLLGEGSTVVMMTDGVLEALPEEGREALMAELIHKTWSRNAREHAKRLMERVYLMQKLQARDDMTVMVGTIWKK